MNVNLRKLALRHLSGAYAPGSLEQSCSEESLVPVAHSSVGAMRKRKNYKMPLFLLDVHRIYNDGRNLKVMPPAPISPCTNEHVARPEIDSEAKEED